MTEVSQGAGWWLASDGRWYPPHLHPHNLPPPPPQWEPAPDVPATGTNGPAIASFVLGIFALLFCLVLGGVVLGIPALIFGYKSRRDSRRNGQQGSGLAVAGLILGWVALPVSILVVGLVVAQWVTHPSTGTFGSTLYGVRVDGQPTSMTTTGLADPVTDTGGGNTTGTSGVHYATVGLSIGNRGNSAIDPSTGWVRVVAFATNGQAYTATADNPTGVRICPSSTSSNGTTLDIPPGTIRQYCAAFVLPETATVSSIEVYGTGTSSGKVVWRNVPDSFTGWKTTRATRTG